MKLTARLEALMTMAAKTVGLDDPQETISIIEEQLTNVEYVAVLKLFKYCKQHHCGFGPANIQERWKQAQGITSKTRTQSSDIMACKTRRPRIVVRLDGGLIQEIWSDSPVEILQLDTDLDGVEPKNCIHYPDSLDSFDPEIRATAWVCQTEDKNDPYGAVSPRYVDKVFARVLPQILTRKAMKATAQR